MADLGAYLKAGTGRPRQACVWDCCSFPSNWVVECGWPDPMVAYRGAYDTDDEGEALTEQAGGLLVLFAPGMDAAGVPPATAPWQAGDVAVVSLLGQQAGAIYTGARWAFVAPRGLAFVSLDDDCVLQGWGPARHG